jgi:bacillolysin
MHPNIKFLLISGLFISIQFSPVFAINGGFDNSATTAPTKRAANALNSDSLTIRYDAEGKSPIYIAGNAAARVSPALGKTTASARNKAQSRSFLSNISRALRINHPAEELIVIDQKNHGTRETARYRIRQHFRGITVLGAQATLHLHGDRAELVGRLVPTPAVATVPTLSADQARERALSDLRAAGVMVHNLKPEERMLLNYDRPSAELVVYPDGTTDHLAYQVRVRPNMIDWWEYIVDAHTGNILLKYNRTCDADATATARDLTGTERVIHTYQTDKYYLIDASRPMFNARQSQIPNQLTGAIVTYDYQNRYPANSSFNLISSSGNTWDPKAVSAQYNASVVYEYYRTVHNRNSLDDKGGSILSFINVADADGGGMDNAYWNGVGMYYGNGRSVFNPLVQALDVSGHEMTHGVVQATADLRYLGQSGALNESFADVFGCMIERNNWKMGEDVVRQGIYTSGAMRDLSDPHNGTSQGKEGWQPRTMKEYRKLPNTTAGDNGGVHVNNGIPNYAFYLFANAVGKEKAEQVYYLTLTDYLSASSQFADMRIAARLACVDLFGEDSPEEKAVTAAFDSVGITDDTQPFEHIADLPVNPGKEYVLLTAAPPAGDGTTMYIADSSFGSLTGISKRRVLFRPSICDDGSKIIFVSEDKQLIALTLNGTNATESVIDTARVWSRCAISRDGRHFAAVHDETDTAMYIGSMNGGPMRKFNLNGPLNGASHAVTGAVISTALEWNFFGDDIVYDVFNSLAGPNGTRLENWDIGFLRGWNPDADSFGDGEVNKLFSTLGDGISVGNPTFSKNSPNIIAYECVDNLTGSVSVMTMNLESRKTVTAAATAFPGYPSYAKRDDRIAYSTIDGRDTVISVVKVKEDKQSVDGDPAIAIRKMKWAIFFADGSRELTRASQPAPVVTAPAAAHPGLKVLSSNGGLKVSITGAANTGGRISIARADGRIVHREAFAATGTGPTLYVWNAGRTIARGVYFIRVETARGYAAKKFVLF